MLRILRRILEALPLSLSVEVFHRRRVGTLPDRESNENDVVTLRLYHKIATIAYTRIIFPCK